MKQPLVCVYGDIFFRFLIQWKLRIGVVQIQFHELFPSCHLFAEVIQRRNWILLQMGDSVHRQFVISANSTLHVSFENWHYRGSPIRIAHWLNHLRQHQPVQFFLYLPHQCVWNWPWFEKPRWLIGRSRHKSWQCMVPFSIPNPSPKTYVFLQHSWYRSLHAAYFLPVQLDMFSFFADLLTCLGYLPPLCFGMILTRLTFSPEDAPKVAPPGERNCRACSFTIVIFTAIFNARSKVRFVIWLSFSSLLRDCNLVPSQTCHATNG